MKSKLLGLGNSKDYNYYMFEKSSSFISKINNCFKDVFAKDCRIRAFDRDFNKNNNYKEIRRDLFKLKDFHETIFNSPRIDIFYGDKIVYLSIICSGDLRIKFNERLMKSFEIPKVKRFK
ncbi:MAG: hypothetical protein WC781_01610 [Candidatus Pacearchaeota archaeon]|jgi:hypothetical protein